VDDPYRWLEAEREPEVQAWMRSQNAFARAQLDRLPGRDALRARLRALMYLESISPPTRRGDRSFYVRRHADKEKAIYYVREGKDGVEQVLLDPHALSKDGSVSISGFSVSRDGRFVAYKLSRNNSDAATLYVLDVATRENLPVDVIEGARYAQASWTPDSSGFYYTGLPVDSKIPPSDLPGYAEVRFHALGTDPRTDALIHPALHDPQTFINANLSRDGRYLVLTISRGFDSTDVSVRDMRRDEAFRPLTVGTPFRAHVVAHAGTLYVHTNDGAPRFRVMAVDPDRLQRERWRELVPETEATLEGMSVIGNRLVLDYLDKASTRLQVRELAGELVRDVALPGLGSGWVVGEPDRDEAYIWFASFTDAPKIYETSIRTGVTRLWNEVDVPADTSDFEVEQVWYASKDGTKISMFLVHRRGIELDGSHPTLLTGYGGFGVSLTPSFSSGAVLWVEHGGVWAVPNLRGGGEYGESWHDAGKLHNKQNVFDDFIGAASWLIGRGYTRPDKLAIRGGSNGGLLVGAVSTQRPDLFGAVVCAVPLLDMIRYHLFGSGKTWISEYGSAEDPEQFRTLRKYSPYHHVEAGKPYPALLMLSADSDDRVDPMHARKFVAAMQAAAPPAHPVLLRVEENAGHGGGDMMAKAVDEAVDVYAFLFERLGAGSDHTGEAQTRSSPPPSSATHTPPSGSTP
jgi:prolyl oligopeptidase